MNAPEAIESLQAVAGRYRAIFCDVWGVVHDGVRRHAEAEAALLAARRGGCRVVLLTNSPRPADGVGRQLDALGFSRDAYDHVVTSGDATRAMIAGAGRRLFHIGPERDRDVFAGLDVAFATEAEAETVVATGLRDDEAETPEDYRETLAALRERDLPMICANPDVVVHRGERLIFCAGALARDYEAIGGEVRMAGKPFAPIYDLAARTVGVTDRGDILAIGDGLNTDIRGANRYGVDALLIVEGVHRDELGGPDAAGARLGAALARHDLAARYVLPTLR